MHAPLYLDFLRSAWDEWVALDPANAALDVLPDSFAARLGLYCFDSGSPLTAGTWAAAREGAACAWTAAQRVAGGGWRTRRLRPHPPAGPPCGRGFLRGLLLPQQRRRGRAVDYHHGNGTQAIFYARDDVYVASLHADPRTDYPYYLGHADERGEGTGFAAWRAALAEALQGIRAYGAEALVVSLGMDTFAGDPIPGFTLQSADYLHVGEDLARAGLPTVFVFEGGYAVAEVGTNTVNVLESFAQQG